MIKEPVHWRHESLMRRSGVTLTWQSAKGSPICTVLCTCSKGSEETDSNHMSPPPFLIAAINHCQRQVSIE